MYNRGLFHTWVPKPLQLLLIIALTIPLLTVSGIYSGNIAEMMGSLGVLSEDLSMASNAATIGMIVVFPLIMGVKKRFKSRQILMVVFSSLILLSLICSTTDEPIIIIGANFLMGGVKIFGMIELILPIMMMISPDGDRGKFYAVFYPISIGLGSIAGTFTTNLAFSSSWQHVYSFAVPVLLMCLLLVLIFSHHSYASKPVPIYQFDWLSLVIYSSALLSINFVLTYGRMKNWWDSDQIIGALIFVVVMLVWFVQRQLTLKRPYMNLAVLKKRNVYSALLFIFFMGLFLSTSSIQSAFTTGILKYSPQISSSTNLMMVPGSIMAGLCCFLWLRAKWSIKGLVFTGFSALILYHISFYFLFSPVIEIQDILFPILLKGFGMTVLYISLGVYAAQNLAMTDMLSSSGIVILFRSFLGTAFWGAIFSTMLYGGQLQHTSNIAQRMDLNDSNVSARISPTVQGMIAQGSSAEVARNVGTQSIWGAVQAQATLAVSKSIFGGIVMFGFILLLFILLYRFGPVNLRHWVKLRSKLRNRQIVKDEEEMIAAIAP